MGAGSLRIGGVQSGDSGLYSCRATNAEDSVDSEAVLTVLGERGSLGTRLVLIGAVPFYYYRENNGLTMRSVTDDLIFSTGT